jgi:L-fuconolactonase
MIIDTHQHFWRMGDPTEKSPRDYMILAAPSGVTGTIFRWMDTQYAMDVAADEPLIVGVCGQIKSGPDFGKELEKFAASPLFRGICCIGSELENVEEGSFFEDMELLAAKDLELDLLRVCPGFFGGPKAMQAAYTGTEKSLEGMFKIAERVPNLRIVVEHIGGMAVDGKPIDKKWVDVFKRIAEHPQMYMKVSGLMERASNRSEGERATELLSFYRPALDVLWETFGEDRLIYGSDWPVCEHAGDFIANGIRIVTPFFAEKGQDAYVKFFRTNSQKAYKWVARLPSQR